MSESPFQANQAVVPVDQGESDLDLLKSIQPNVEALMDLNRRLRHQERLADSAQQLEEAKKAIIRHTLTEALHRVSHLPKAVAVLELMIEETHE